MNELETGEPYILIPGGNLSITGHDWFAYEPPTPGGWWPAKMLIRRIWWILKNRKLFPGVKYVPAMPPKRYYIVSVTGRTIEVREDDSI